MIPLAPSIAVVLAVTITAPISTPPINPPLPVVEVVKVYGRLAGPTCYGMTAPPASSCQIQRQDLLQKLNLLDDDGNAETARSIQSRKEWGITLEQLDFQWPLKPYGVDKSLSKTAVMNKGAETRVFMDELEARGLYDRRNPTGPLPTWTLVR